jgi:hypothetical protein
MYNSFIDAGFSEGEAWDLMTRHLPDWELAPMSQKMTWMIQEEIEGRSQMYNFGGNKTVAKKGMHKMPDGTMMKNSDMKKKPGIKKPTVKKKGK